MCYCRRVRLTPGLPAGNSSDDFAHMVPTHSNVLVGVDQSLADFARKSMDEMFHPRNDPAYGICICGGQGDCIGCKELEIESILRVWP